MLLFVNMTIVVARTVDNVQVSEVGVDWPEVDADWPMNDDDWSAGSMLIGQMSRGKLFHRW